MLLRIYCGLTALSGRQRRQTAFHAPTSQPECVGRQGLTSSARPSRQTLRLRRPLAYYCRSTSSADLQNGPKRTVYDAPDATK